MTASISFAGQLTPAHMVQVAEQGFKSVMNNRPDLEGGAEQPLSQTYKKRRSA